jgi:hypothetical protein
LSQILFIAPPAKCLHAEWFHYRPFLNRWRKRVSAVSHFDELVILAVVDQDARDALLPQICELAKVGGIRRAVKNGAEKTAEARIGRHHFEPQSAVDRGIRVEAGEGDVAVAGDAELQQIASAVTTAQPLETAGPGCAGEQPGDAADDAGNTAVQAFAECDGDVPALGNPIAITRATPARSSARRRRRSDTNGRPA